MGNTEDPRATKKEMVRASSEEPLTLGPDAKDIDFSAVSTPELVAELKRRFAGFLFITYEHTEKSEDSDGTVWMKGSATVIRGLRDALNDEVNNAVYGGPDKPG
jgi:hypothetical protein